MIDRHDILRTAIHWDGLAQPVQVVWRKAVLLVEEINLDAGAGDVSRQMWDRYDPRHYRMDLVKAPLLRVYIAHDQQNDRWLLLMLKHHLIGDHSTLEVMQEEDLKPFCWERPIGCLCVAIFPAILGTGASGRWPA